MPPSLRNYPALVHTSFTLTVSVMYLNIYYLDYYINVVVIFILQFYNRSTGTSVPFGYQTYAFTGNATGLIVTYNLTTRIIAHFTTDPSKEYQGFSINWSGIYVDLNKTATIATTTTTTTATTSITATEPTSTGNYAYFTIYIIL